MWCCLAAISGPFLPTWQKRSTKTKEAATRQKNKTNKTGKQQTALKMRGLPCGSMRVAVIMYAKMCPDSGFATYLLTDSSLASNLWFLALLLGVLYLVGLHSVSATQQHETSSIGTASILPQLFQATHRRHEENQARLRKRAERRKTYEPAQDAGWQEKVPELQGTADPGIENADVWCICWLVHKGTPTPWPNFKDL